MFELDHRRCKLRTSTEGVLLHQRQTLLYPILDLLGSLTQATVGIFRLWTRSEPEELNIIQLPQVQSSTVSLRDVLPRGFAKEESLTAWNLNLSAAIGAQGDEPNGGAEMELLQFQVQRL